jgi:hypothetical protein
MTTFTMRRVGGDFVVTGPDIEPKKFKTRREARDWCTVHYPGSPIREIVPLRKRPTGEGTAHLERDFAGAVTRSFGRRTNRPSRDRALRPSRDIRRGCA